MASLPDPDWPASLRNKEQLLEFLYSKSVPALATDIFNVEFRLGVYGSYAADETACTDDHGDRYGTFIFGKVVKPVGPKPVFRVDGGPQDNSALHQAFTNQVNQLAAMVKDGDEDDSMNGDFNIAVHPCTDSDREHGTGGTWIEIDVGGIPVFRDGAAGLVKTMASRAADVRLNVGDWIVVRASLHRVDDRSGYRLRHFYVNADAIRVLDWDPDNGAGTDDDTLSEVSVDGKPSSNKTYADVPDSKADEKRPLDAELVVESSDTDEVEELRMAGDVAAVAAEAALTTLAEPVEEGNTSTPSGIKRGRSSSLEPAMVDPEELNDSPATPVRKRGRTARVASKGKRQKRNA
ncbi:hypothetical protein B0H14DRAFT_3427597 [Mycena olivaceomarginata]|nr:hypothetical protein B0H14DRAFT_3427597 [Mycena olivaceomarginata]